MVSGCVRSLECPSALTQCRRRYPTLSASVCVSCASCGCCWKMTGLTTNSIIFCVPFGEKIFYLPGGQTPRWGNTSLPFLPATPSTPSQTFEGLFELTLRPSRAPRLASCVASGTTEIQGHCQVCRARRRGPRTPSTTVDANLDCAFVENALFLHTDP